MSLTRFSNSSIGKKQIMALSGLLLVGFLVAHLSGNFILFAGLGSFNKEQAKIIANASNQVSVDLSKSKNIPNAEKLKAISDESTDIETIPINQYAKKLRDLGPILWVMRIGLITLFLMHFLMFIQTATVNKLARPVPYAVKKSSGGETLGSSTMMYTGIILLAYVFLHLCDFTWNFFGTSPEIDGVNLGLYGIIVNGFKNPVHAGLYIFAMLVLGLHVSHALQSACQTFGINHPVYTPQIKKASLGLGTIIALGYISIPLYVFIAL